MVKLLRMIVTMETGMVFFMLDRGKSGGVSVLHQLISEGLFVAIQGLNHQNIITVSATHYERRRSATIIFTIFTILTIFNVVLQIFTTTELLLLLLLRLLDCQEHIGRIESLIMRRFNLFIATLSAIFSILSLILLLLFELFVIDRTLSQLLLLLIGRLWLGNVIRFGDGILLLRMMMIPLAQLFRLLSQRNLFFIQLVQQHSFLHVSQKTCFV